MTLVKAEDPPNVRLNQVRNYSLILHHCYLSLNVKEIILEKSRGIDNFIQTLRRVEQTDRSASGQLTDNEAPVPRRREQFPAKWPIVPDWKNKILPP